MQLSLHADYACRVLMYLATTPEEKTSIQAISEGFDISENHLVKVVHRLGKEDFLITTRGRGGGIRLARAPSLINLGDVIRRMEPHFNLVECFDKETNSCPLVRVCELKQVLAKARDAFLSALDNFTLADITTNQAHIAKSIGIRV